ncbi:hypothetical protein C8T65DRAFT_302301 [Cerioporus squamosus]|nr:hypothetical protein C8T65DRAFT_302301 [Cerioporus squamosus]
MPVYVEFLNSHPAPIYYADPMTAFRDLRTRALKAETLVIHELSVDNAFTNGVPELLDEIKPSVEDLSISVVPADGQLRQCPLYDLTPSEFRRLKKLTVGGFYPSSLNNAFDLLQRLELRASGPLMPCVNLHVLLTGMNHWSSLTELCLHHYMRVFTTDPLPDGYVVPAGLPPRLERLVVEDAPNEVWSLLSQLILPPHVRLHLIASCPSFPVDAGPLFQMLTPTHSLEFFAAQSKVDLPILGQVSEILVDFTDNLKITGVANQVNTIILEIRAPPPLPGSMASRPALLSAAIRRLPELFNNGLGPEQQSVRKLVVDADVSHVSKHDWLRPLGRYGGLWELYVTDRAMGSSRAVLKALCESGDAYLVCPHLYTLELSGFAYGNEKDFAALLRTLETRHDHQNDLANLTVRYLCDPSATAESLANLSDTEEEVKAKAPNTVVQVELSQDGLRGVNGGYW